MIGWLIAGVSIALVGVALWALARQIGRPTRMRVWTPLIAAVFAPLMLLLNLLFLRQASPGAWALGLGLAGVVFGTLWGRTTRLRLGDGGTVEAERSSLHLVMWGIAFALTQVLAAAAEARWVAGGLAAMFFATGVTMGSSVDLTWRYRKVSQAAPHP